MLILILLAQGYAHFYPSSEGIETRSYAFSDLSNKVVGPSHPSGGLAVRTWEHSAWTAVIPGATWIWDSYQVSNPSVQQVSVFSNHFTVNGDIRQVLLHLAADNSVSVEVNQMATGCSKEGGSFSKESQFSCDLTSFVFEGLNEIKFTVVNLAGGGHYTSNPAGLLYRVTIITLV